MNLKSKFAISIFIFVQSFAFGQNSTNSPYTRYGYGELSDPSFGAQKAMGGISYGLRESRSINPGNPASFSNVDSLTFMADMGTSLQFSWYEDGINKTKNKNSQIEYIAMQFPLYKHLGMGLGFTPISNVGYQYGEDDSFATKSYQGSGGLNQLYGALSYNFKRISVGMNVAYIFGDIKHGSQVSFIEQSTNTFLKSDTLRMSGFLFDVGVQYIHPLENNQRIVLGAKYTPRLNLSGRYSGQEITYNSSYIQTIEPLSVPDNSYGMPETYGVGFTYSKGTKLLLGFDYTFQQWEDVKFQGQTNFNNRNRFNLGGEFTPDMRSRNYFDRVSYRLGANYSNSYVSPYSVDDQSFHELQAYTLVCGLGLPLSRGRSSINLAFEYAATTPKSNITGLINEKYLKITVSYTFNELWFYQRKVE